MNIYRTLFLLCILLVYPCRILNYTLPSINLGMSSFLDGGPLRQIPGWYIQNYTQDYNTHRFLDNHGKPLLGLPSPHYNLFATTFQLTYLSKSDFFGLGSFGFDITQPIALSSRINKNDLGIKAIGGGFGDLAIGVFAQAHPIMRGDRPLYVQRLEFVASFPTGKEERPLFAINPGNGVAFIDPYWAATLYFTPTFCASWRLHYLWVAMNHKTRIKAGDAIHMNFSLETKVSKRLWIGMNGYFLQQIKDSTFNHIKIPDSKERVLALGFGALYSFERRYASVLIGNLYFEMLARNRPQGFKMVIRYLKHFY